MTGNFLGYCIDRNANIIDHPFNRRVVGVDGDTFRVIPRRVMISAGINKVEAIRAIVSNGLVTDLITDETTARALLN
jgi:DNA-binding transcriptional regulator LsrR (DeoR family)